MSGNTNSGTAPSARKPDSRAKVVFLAIVIAVAVAIYLWLQRSPDLLGWPGDIDAALAEARKTDRKVLALFTSDPPSYTARRLAETTLTKGHNRQALADGKFLCVHTKVDSALTGKTARRFGLTKLPTTLILSPTGIELNRREGMIGEVPFRHGFLDCSEVQGPKSE